MEATFADVMKREIPEFLTPALEAKQIVASKKRVHVTLKSPSGAPIVVKDRVDRNEVVADFAVPLIEASVPDRAARS